MHQICMLSSIMTVDRIERKPGVGVVTMAGKPPGRVLRAAP
jgi:hypothetical protein